MADTIFTEKEISFLRELVRHKVPFMIVGLSAATLQGAPVVTQDVDLWFQRLDHPGIKKALKKCGGTYIPPIGLNPPMFAGGNLELFDIVMYMHGLEDFQAELAHALDVDLAQVQVKVLGLRRIIDSKVAANRAKDKLVLPVLKDALRAVERK